MHTFTALETLRIVIQKDWFHTHLYILSTLPPTLRVLAFELCWSDSQQPEDCLNGLEVSPFEKCVAERLPNLTEILFTPHYFEARLDEQVQGIIRTRLASLDAHGLLHISAFCEGSVGCLYDFRSPATPPAEVDLFCFTPEKLAELWDQ